MGTIKSVIGRMTGAASRATQFKKSARTSAGVFAKAGLLGKARAGRKGLGAYGG